MIIEINGKLLEVLRLDIVAVNEDEQSAIIEHVKPAFEFVCSGPARTNGMVVSFVDRRLLIQKPL